jgi:mRNA interferase MazF
VTVAPVTTRVRHIRAEVVLGPADGLPRPCVANVDTITTVPVANLQDYVTTLSADKIAAIDAAIHYALGLPT